MIKKALSQPLQQQLRPEPLVGVAWDGLPFYAARLLRSAASTNGIRLGVVGLGLPPHSADESENAFGDSIVWAKRHDSQISWKSLLGETPRLCITSGWSSNASVRLAEQVKQDGGKVCLMADNRWTGSLRQLVSPLVFSRRFAPLFDYVWVPGKSAAGFMRYLGFPPSRIFTGLYGADATIFTAGPPLSSRAKRFIFAGQLVDRKGIDILLKAFHHSDAHRGGWSLDIFGEGILADQLAWPPGAEFKGFVSAVDFAESLRHSRCLILPSRQDNWGVVVHEAACAGCALVTSNKAGVADDLVTKKNGHVFDSGRVASLTSALKLLQSWNADAWNQAGQESLRLAGQFGPKKWQAVFADLCREAGVAVVASDHR
jgi:hypothetical protein